MFEIVVGEGGISPDYFHRRLTFREANLIIRGIGRRHRASWEQARLIADVQAKCAGNKQGIRVEFPWEKEAKALSQRPPSKEELERLQQEMRSFEDRLNGKKAG